MMKGKRKERYDEVESSQDLLDKKQKLRTDDVESQASNEEELQINDLDESEEEFLHMDIDKEIACLEELPGGKSAILTALMVVFGGKASITSRAKNLGSLVKQDTNAATVRIIIRNEGPNSLQSKLFKNKIIIERRITKDGVGTYRFLDANGKLVSTKRDTLNLICQHWNIQVDNPLCILTQDTARQFLQDSSDEQRYKFFLKATNLLQLEQEYREIINRISRIKSDLEGKEESLESLKKEYNIAKRVYDDMKSVLIHYKKLDEAKNELIWSFVSEAKGKVIEAEGRLSKMQDKIESWNDRINDFEGYVKDLEDKIAMLQSAANEVSKKLEPILGDIDSNASSLREKAGIVKGIQQEEQELMGTIRKQEKQIRELDEQINAERKKLEELQKGVQDEKRNTLEKLEYKIDELKRRVQSAVGERDELVKQRITKKEESDSINRRINETSRQRDALASELQKVNNARSDRLKLYGNNIPQILEAIKNERRFGKKPIGPIGLTLKLVRPEWGPCAEDILGDFSTEFIVNDYEDLKLLRSIFDRHGNRNTKIHVRKFDSHIPPNEHIPDSKFITLAKIFEVNNQVVLDVLKITHHFDRVILFESRKTACDVMERLPKNVAYAVSLTHQKIEAKSGSMTCQTIGKRNSTKYFSDIDSQKGIIESKLNEKIKEIAHIRSQLDIINEERHVIESDILAANQKIRKIELEISNIQRQVNEVKNEIAEDEPVSVSVLEAEKDQLHQSLEINRGQLEQLKNEIRILAEEFKELKGEKKKLVERRVEIENERGAIDKDLESFINEKNIQQRDRSHYESQRENCLKKKNEILDEIEDLKSDYEDKKKRATTVCEPILSNRNHAEIESEMLRLEALIENTEKQYGTIESAQENYKKAKTKLDSAKSIIESSRRLVFELEQAITIREKNRQILKKMICVRIKHYFSVYLSTRGFLGRIKFQHENQLLTLDIRTSQDEGKKGNSRKDIKTLSGGEKSFSTVSFLLCLWEAMSMPIRALDEFDVFMDAVNRRISMKMLTDFANEHSVQYLLITPQDTSVIPQIDSVKVIRVADPVRTAK